MAKLKEWWNDLIDDAVERYEAEFEFIEKHPFLGTFFYYMKWMFIVYFAIILLMAYKTGKVWDLVEREQ